MFARIQVIVVMMKFKEDYSAANRCVEMLKILFKSNILSKKSLKLFKVLVGPIALNGCEIRPTAMKITNNI